MKLYRSATPLEISDNKTIFGSAVDMGFFVPIEITEEEIEDILRKYSLIGEGGWVVIKANNFEDVAEAILSKLKGDE